MPAQELIIAIGFSGKLGELKEWGFTIERNTIVVDPLTMETGLPGVFAAGDIITHPAKFKLIATGAAEAVIAVNHAVTYIDPSARLDPGIPPTSWKRRRAPAVLDHPNQVIHEARRDENRDVPSLPSSEPAYADIVISLNRATIATGVMRKY